MDKYKYYTTNNHKNDECDESHWPTMNNIMSIFEFNCIAVYNNNNFKVQSSVSNIKNTTTYVI